MKVSILVQRLVLRHAFKLAKSTSVERTSFIVRIEDARGCAGIGEATPLHYLGETPEALEARLRLLEGLVQSSRAEFERALEDAERWARARGRGQEGGVGRAPFGTPTAPLETIYAFLRKSAPGSGAALCAFDVALHDLLARRLGVPLARLLGTDADRAPKTSYTVAIAPLDEMQSRAREAIRAGHEVLKIKVGAKDGPRTPDIARAVREVHSGTLILDANGAWSFDEARRELSDLEAFDLEFVEQPLPRGTPELLGTLRRESGVPLFADEDVLDSSDLDRLPPELDGINIKLMKAGGLTEAIHMIGRARQEGWRLMLGCMIESSVGISAAAHLAGAFDYCDLDGALLLANDPAEGALIRPDGVTLKREPGHGARLLQA